MSRSPALVSICCLALLGAFAPLGTLEGAPDRPNILWLVSEDNNPYLGAYGDPLAHTPTLDTLSKEGVTYERCFSQPVCAPSRFALITGMHSVSCGPAEHMRAQGKIPSWLRGFPSLLKDAGYFVTNNSKTDYNSPIDPAQTWNISGKNGHYNSRPDPKQPFFSVFNHEVTHESCLFPAQNRLEGFSPMDPAKVRIPAYQPDTPEIRADWARYYDQMRQLDGQIAAKLADLEKAGLAEDTIIFYYGDNGGVLPRSKRFLHRSGTHVPLIVYFPPKWRHLSPAAPGSRIADPVSFVDFAPTVLSLAGLPIPSHMHGRAFAGTSKAEPNAFVFCSRDRMDERYDMVRSVVDKRWLYIRNYRPDLPYVQPLAYMFQARGYQSWARVAREGKLTAATAQFWGEKPTEELYDLNSDPDNIQNLAADPLLKQTLQKMREALKKHVLEVVDNGFLPEGSSIEGYENSRLAGAYPLERIVDLANLASERNPAHLDVFIKALDDPNEAVRWWAAQGCAMLKAKAAPATDAMLKHLNDASQSVAVCLAGALAHSGKMEAALPVFEKALSPDAPATATLQAANVLTHLGDLAKPALPAMKNSLSAVDALFSSNSKADKVFLRYPKDLLTRTIGELEGRTERLIYPTPRD